jgi:hypothetical protein
MLLTIKGIDWRCGGPAAIMQPGGAARRVRYGPFMIGSRSQNLVPARCRSADF